jgi:hypothetical protein
MKEKRRSAPLTEEHKRKISAALKGRTMAKDHLAKMSAAVKLSHSRPEVRKKMSDSHKGIPQSDASRLLKSIALKGRRLSKERCDKIGNIHRGKIVTQQQKDKQSLAMSGRDTWNKGLTGIYSEEQLKKMSIMRTGRILSENHKRKIGTALIGHNTSGETRKKISDAHSKLWQDSEYALRMGKTQNKRPNKPETILLNLLEELYPDEWKYTGDFSFMINGKNPDFVNCNGQKQIIELFGDYWHKGEDPKERAAIFKPFGYKTLVVWEKELSDIKKLTHKLKRFCGARNYCQKVMEAM